MHRCLGKKLQEELKIEFQKQKQVTRRKYVTKLEQNKIVETKQKSVCECYQLYLYYFVSS